MVGRPVFYLLGYHSPLALSHGDCPPDHDVFRTGRLHVFWSVPLARNRTEGGTAATLSFGGFSQGADAPRHWGRGGRSRRRIHPLVTEVMVAVTTTSTWSESGGLSGWGTVPLGAPLAPQHEEPLRRTQDKGRCRSAIWGLCIPRGHTRMREGWRVYLEAPNFRCGRSD
jgi:hypothetical protein